MSYILAKYIPARNRRIEETIARANAEGRELPLEGTAEDLTAATLQAFRKMTEEQKGKTAGVSAMASVRLEIGRHNSMKGERKWFVNTV